MNKNIIVKNYRPFSSHVSRLFPSLLLILMLAVGIFSLASCGGPSTPAYTDYSQQTVASPSGTYIDNSDKSTGQPTEKITGKPTGTPSFSPTYNPTDKPTAKPTDKAYDSTGFYDIFPNSHFYPDDTTAHFTHLPMDYDQISSIVPLGEADSAAGEDTAAIAAGAGAHVLPTDHITVFSGQKMDSHVYTVYAVADSCLIQVDYQKGRWAAPDGTLNKVDDIALTFQVSKNLFIIETHLTVLDPDLAAKIGTLTVGDHNYPNFKVTSGQVLGQGGGTPYLNSNDLWAIDLSKPAQFIHPDWWGSRSGYANSALNYYDDPLRAQLLSRLPVRPEPRDGQFAFDVDGKLIGSWFPKLSSANPDKPPQQRANLGFFYYTEKPSVIKIGYDTTGTVYVIKGNGPDPANIGVDSGLVKYELMNSRHQDKNNPSSFTVEATMLVQMTGDRTLKMELFTGKTADEVTGFDSNALDFIR